MFIVVGGSIGIVDGADRPMQSRFCKPGANRTVFGRVAEIENEARHTRFLKQRLDTDHPGRREWRSNGRTRLNPAFLRAPGSHPSMVCSESHYDHLIAVAIAQMIAQALFAPSHIGADVAIVRP